MRRTAILLTIVTSILLSGCAILDPFLPSDPDLPEFSIHNVNSQGFNYVLDATDWPQKWVEGNGKRRLCDGMIVMNINGSGGKNMEWSPVDRTRRDWHNLDTHYSGLHRPASGTSCEMWVVSVDGVSMSESVSFKFP